MTPSIKYNNTHGTAVLCNNTRPTKQCLTKTDKSDIGEKSSDEVSLEFNENDQTTINGFGEIVDVVDAGHIIIR